MDFPLYKILHLINITEPELSTTLFPLSITKPTTKTTSAPVQKLTANLRKKM